MTDAKVTEPLDARVDELVGRGVVVIYVLAKYAYDPPGVEFHSRAAWPDGIDPDVMVSAMVSDPNNMWLPAALDGVQTDLRVAGYESIILAYDRDGPGIMTQLQLTDQARESISHRRLDLLREALVAWSDARHT